MKIWRSICGKERLLLLRKHSHLPIPLERKKKENQLKKGALNADLCPVLEKSSLQPAGILTAAGQLCRHEDKECIF